MIVLMKLSGFNHISSFSFFVTEFLMLLMTWTELFLVIFTRMGMRSFDKLSNGNAHLSHATEKDGSHLLLLCSALDAIHSCLPSHGNAGKMSDRCFKVHRSEPFYDKRSSFIHTHTHIHCLSQTTNITQPFIPLKLLRCISQSKVGLIKYVACVKIKVSNYIV